MRRVAVTSSALLVALCGCGSDKAPATNPGKDAGSEASAPTACDPAKPFGTPTALLDLPAAGFRLGPDYLTGYFQDLASLHLFSVSRADVTQPWGAPTPLSKLATLTGEDSSPSVTRDDLKLYFASDRSAVATYIYAAKRANATLDFANPDALSGVNRVGASRFTPFIREDEGALYFASSADASDPNLELFRATKTGDLFDSPMPLTELNSTAPDSSPTVTPDDLVIYFASQRMDGNAQGDYDIWTASRSSAQAPFNAPVNVAELNTASAELVDFISRDGCEIFFHTNRENGVFKIYSASKPK